MQNCATETVDYLLGYAIIVYKLILMESIMIESVEIRRAANGFISAVTDDSGDVKEMVYESNRKLVRELKKMIEEMTVSS